MLAEVRGPRTHRSPPPRLRNIFAFLFLRIFVASRLPLKPSRSDSVRLRPLPALFALLCSALVLALGVVAVDGELHARLHAAAVSDCGHAHDEAPAHPTGDHEATCAVELFAAGISLPVDPTHRVVEPAPGNADFPPADAIRLTAVPHALPPSCGPPRA